MTRDVAIGVGACTAATCLAIATAAAAVVATGTADDVRRSLRLSFPGVEQTSSEVLSIAFHNARIAAATFLCALGVPRLPRRALVLVDALLATVLALNTTLVGIAAAAYGTRLFETTRAHLPIEFGAFALAAGTYLAARRRPVPVRPLLSAAAFCAALLLVAAATETYVSGAMR